MTRVKYIGQIIIMTDIDGDHAQIKADSERITERIVDMLKVEFGGHVEVTEQYREVRKVEEG